MHSIEGYVHKYGDHINTDYIIASRRKRDVTDPGKLTQYALEDLDANFAERVKQGDILVGGVNFGCGSAMEIAVTVLKACGIKAVLAKTFARAFYRNAINNGLLALECDTDSFSCNDITEIILHEAGNVIINNKTKNKKISAESIPPFINEVIISGGILNYLNRYKEFNI